MTAPALSRVGRCILAELDPFEIGGLFGEIKSSTGIPIGEIRKQYDTMAGARRGEVGRAERVLPFAVYQPTTAIRPLADVLDEVADLSEHEYRVLKMAAESPRRPVC